MDKVQAICYMQLALILNGFRYEEIRRASETMYYCIDMYREIDAVDQAFKWMEKLKEQAKETGDSKSRGGDQHDGDDRGKTD